MMFRSPGTAPPAEWPTDRRGNLQRSAGFSTVSAVTLYVPRQVTPSACLEALAARNVLRLAANDTESYALALGLERPDGSELQLRF
jgi:hypothetical protein